MPKDEKVRRRMVVEEVDSTSANSSDFVSSNQVMAPVETVVPEDVIEKVEELRDLTHDISASIEKSEDLQKEILETVSAEEVSKPTDDLKVNIDDEPLEDKKVESQMPIEEHFSIQKPVSKEELFPTPQLKSTDSVSPLVIIVPGIFLLGALLGGIYFYQKNVSSDVPPSPSPTLTVVTQGSNSPTATPAATVDLTKYAINVMNGSGIVGEAGKVKTLVEGAGFKVSATGNASSYDYTKTVIKAKADVPADFLAKLSTTLSKNYVLDNNAVLSISSPDMVQVIIGSTKAK